MEFKIQTTGLQALSGDDLNHWRDDDSMCRISIAECGPISIFRFSQRIREDPSMWLRALPGSPPLFCNAPLCIRANPSVAKVAVKLDIGNLNFVCETLTRSYDFLSEAVLWRPEVAGKLGVPPELAMKAIRHFASAYFYFDAPSLSMARAAVKADYKVYEDIRPYHKTDLLVVKALVDHDSSLFCKVPFRLMIDKQFALQAVAWNDDNILHFPTFASDDQVCDAAIDARPLAFFNLPKLQRTPERRDRVLKKAPLLIFPRLSKQLRDERSIAFQAVGLNGRCFSFLCDGLKNDLLLALIASKNSLEALSITTADAVKHAMSEPKNALWGMNEWIAAFGTIQTLGGNVFRYREATGGEQGPTREQVFLTRCVDLFSSVDFASFEPARANAERMVEEVVQMFEGDVRVLSLYSSELASWMG